MGETFANIKKLVAAREIRISEHASLELEKDDVFLTDLLDSFESASLVEDYPDHGRGPCVLLLHRTRDSRVVHAVWRVPAGYSTPVVLVTAYLSDAERWDEAFMRRVR